MQHFGDYSGKENKQEQANHYAHYYKKD